MKPSPAIRRGLRAPARTGGRCLQALLALVATPAIVMGCTRTIVADAPVSQRDQTVSGRMLLTQGSPAYKAEDDQRFVMPQPFPGNPSPAYPPMPAGIASPPGDVRVVVILIADETGDVVEVRPTDPEAHGVNQVFFEQVRSACERWRFTPLQVRTTRVLPDGEVFGQPKVRVATEVEELPFSLTYEFVFSERSVVRSAPRGEATRRPL